MPFSALQQQLDQRAARGLLRRRYTVQSPQSPNIVVDGKNYLSFCSNDYLGLAGHPDVITALADSASRFGVGAGAAHLVSGHSQAHQHLENALASFVRKPQALLFSTGYMANLGVVQALVGKGDHVFADKLNHASLNDAMLLSRATVHRYRHNDIAHLGKLLAAVGNGRKLLITDAVFSMDGDLALLPELLALCEKHGAWLYVDDAHGFGVLGEQGRGTAAHFNLASPRIIHMATLGKAAGVFGAFVAADRVVIATLVNQAHSYVYTTATPPALSGALLASLCLIEHGDERRLHLQRLITQLRCGLRDLPWRLMPSATPIQPVLIGDNQAALSLSSGLRDRGIWVAAIRPPTVPQGTARLRITLSAAHSEAEVARLLEALHDLAR
ncbi:MAG: 8-amino-7-oxononanoate synthase [Gallionella sp.]